MPAYNEEDNIELVVKSWYQVLESCPCSSKSKIVVADSGSTDKTHAILTKMTKTYPRLSILSETDKQHGPKVIALYKYAIKKKANYVFQTDSDGQTDPAEFKEFWNKRKEYDAILGFRKVRGDGRARAFVEKVVCSLLNLYFGVKVPDANAPFRLMRTDILGKYIIKIPNTYNLPNIIITAFLVYNKENVVFKTISFSPRQAGTNSINIPKIVKIGWHALGDFSMFKKEMRNNEQAA